MNKYKVRLRDIYDGTITELTVVADSFYTESGNATFSIGEYGPEYFGPPKAIAYYRDVESIEKLEDE